MNPESVICRQLYIAREFSIKPRSDLQKGSNHISHFNPLQAILIFFKLTNMQVPSMGVMIYFLVTYCSGAMCVLINYLD